MENLNINLINEGGNNYQAEIESPGGLQMQFVSDQLNGSTRYIVLNLSESGNDPVNTPVYTRAANEDKVNASVFNAAGAKVGGGVKDYD